MHSHVAFHQIVDDLLRRQLDGVTDTLGNVVKTVEGVAQPVSTTPFKRAGQLSSTALNFRRL